MLELFSTREQATAILSLVLFVIAIKNTNVRKCLIRIVKTACTPQLLTPLIIMILYGCLILYALPTNPLRELKLLKDVIVWFILAGIPMCYKTISRKKVDNYFKNILLDNMKLLAIVEFFIGTFTFNILIELIMQIIIGFLIIMQTFSQNKEEYKQVNTFFSRLIIISSFIILFFTIKTAIIEYRQLEILDTIRSFVLPIILTLLYLPVAYLISLYTKYESVFCRMRFKEPKNIKVKIKNRVATILVCGISINKVVLFEQRVVRKMYVRSESQSQSLMNLIKVFKAQLKL